MAEEVHGLLEQFSPSLLISVDEIEGYGMRFNAEYMTRPYITDWTLERIFGYKADLVNTIYLKPRTDDAMSWKVSMRKIKAVVAGKDDENSLALHDGLYRSFFTKCV